MYAQFFNLREMPFTITPDPAYLYLSPRHQEALGHLLYGTGQYGGFVQLTGEVGTGKTTIVRTLLEQKLVDVDLAMLHNPSQNELQFVQSICDELGATYDAADLTLKKLVDALNAHLLKTHAAGRRTVLIIDEAQNLPRDVLEQVRLLTNLETHKEKLLRIMLIGQPELGELLARPDLRQLASRITARYHLMPLTQAETVEYIRHRLRVAGSHEELFAADAVREIHRITRGVPRLINILCDRSLLGAYAQGARRVTPDIVRRAADESIGAAPSQAPERRTRTLPAWARDVTPMAWLEAALALAALVIATVLTYQTFFRPADEPAATTAETRTQAEPEKSAAISTKSSDTSASDSTAAVAAPAATADAPAPAAASKADLTTLLQSAQPLPEVVSRLIRLWDHDIVIPKDASICHELSAHGLECYKSSGEWADLRNMNRPAVLSLTTGRGEVQHVLLRGLTANTATIDSALGTLDVPLDQLDALWTGEFLLLWKRETADTHLAQGMRGASVVWVRRRLADFNKQALSEPIDDRYGPELSEQVRHFQTQRGLDSDGVAGIRTLIALGERTPGTPTLGPTR